MHITYINIHVCIHSYITIMYTYIHMYITKPFGSAMHSLETWKRGEISHGMFCSQCWPAKHTYIHTHAFRHMYVIHRHSHMCMLTYTHTHMYVYVSWIPRGGERYLYFWMISRYTLIFLSLSSLSLSLFSLSIRISNTTCLFHFFCQILMNSHLYLYLSPL